MGSWNNRDWLFTIQDSTSTFFIYIFLENLLALWVWMLSQETWIPILATNYDFMVFVSNEKLPLWKDMTLLVSETLLKRT